MNTKLIAALACGAALALGACSGGAPATSTTTPTTPDPTDPADPAHPGTDDRTDAQKAFDTALTNARAALATARTNVTSAKALADDADTAAKRTAATAALNAARTGLTTAVNRIKALTAPTGDVNRRGQAIALATQADAALAEDTPKLTAGENAIRTSANAGTWFGGESRYPRADNKAVPAAVPTTTLSIDRRVRNASASTDHADLLDSDSFAAIPYAAGNFLISAGQGTCTVTTTPARSCWFPMRGIDIGPKGGIGGGERTSNNSWPSYSISVDGSDFYGSSMIAGLKIEDDGLTMQLGGKWTAGLDFMRDLGTTVPLNRAGLAGTDTAGWDLTLTFGEPGRSPDGNGDFYWTAPLYIDETQRGQAKQPVSGSNSYRANKLGTYEVWLTNFLSVNYQTEYTDRLYPGDDTDKTFLKYAAYGSMVFAPESGFSGEGQHGRIHAFQVGYDAFADEDGKKTTDISSANAITTTSGKFVGKTTGFTTPTIPVLGSRYFTDVTGAKRIRGNVELTATISGTTANNSISGSIKGIQYWDAPTTTWRSYGGLGSNGITLAAASIADDGSFASGNTNGTSDPRAANAFGPGAWGGAFYGPQDSLEVAGTWFVYSHHSVDPDEGLVGSFGAKYEPAPAAGN